MYLSIRKEAVKGLPRKFQENGVKLFPRVALDFHGKYEQTWKFNKDGNYSRAKREPKWKYKVYLCGSYRIDGKARNKQILLEIIYYWDIIDRYINSEKKKSQVWDLDESKYNYHEFDESWLPMYSFEDMSEEVFLNIKEWLQSGDKSEQRVLCRMITDKLRSEIQAIKTDYRTTAEYITIKANEEIIKDCIKEAEWLNISNGFK